MLLRLDVHVHRAEAPSEGRRRLNGSGIERGGTVRFNLKAFNTRAEIDEAVEAAGRVIVRTRRPGHVQGAQRSRSQAMSQNRNS